MYKQYLSSMYEFRREYGLNRIYFGDLIEIRRGIRAIVSNPSSRWS